MAEFTLPYLESLSTAELIEHAGARGIDIPSALERVFIIEELFYLDHEDEPEHTETAEYRDSHHHEFREFAALPRQYHISFVEALIRDPLWVFVFWEIKAHDKALHENTAGFEGYCLKVIPLTEDNATANGADSFIVTIGPDDSARYLGFPPDNGRCFKTALCALNSINGETTLAESRPFTLPRLVEPKDERFQEVYHNPLARLSGITSFSLARSEDRVLRPRAYKE